MNDLDLALQLADAADAITMRDYRSRFLDVRIKSDFTPVSAADEAAEKELRAILGRERPEDGVVGEEFGESASGSRRWILDPIDGTKNYIRGVPVFATLIALEADGEIVAGVVSAPALQRRWWASRGKGAFVNGERLEVSRISSIEESYFSYDDLVGFADAGLEPKFISFAKRCARTRAFGDAWSHMLVAEGAVDVAIEPHGLKLWDYSPLRIIVEEAGGRVTDLRGETKFEDGSVVATNGRLHKAVLEHFR